ncbi:MAG: hypothetical protein VX475_16190, partial [Myxococcota bacterium]|nr:hypothetical protein [Myxococcota bacterium]
MFHKTIEVVCISILLTSLVTACGSPTVQYEPREEEGGDMEVDMSSSTEDMSTPGEDMQTPLDMNMDMGPPPECVEDA